VTTKVSINCSKDQLKQIREFLSGLLQTESVDASLRDQVILAVDEACANAIIHGNLCDEKKEIAMKVDISPKRLAIKIYDIGDFKMPSKKLNEDLSSLVKKKKKGGLGLKLMYSIMDEVKFYREGKVNVCSMVKLL
jgi:serine/threonine-protein kinase RsbW